MTGSRRWRGAGSCEGRTNRAIADVHLVREDPAEIRAMIGEVNHRADVLCVCGDMTTHGTPKQMRVFCDTITDVECPIVAVLGNHDHHSGAVAELNEILRNRGISLLAGNSVVIHCMGFVGVKGLGGGFGDHLLDPFGESEHSSRLVPSVRSGGQTCSSSNDHYL